jgi:hypothetical protein
MPNSNTKNVQLLRPPGRQIEVQKFSTIAEVYAKIQELEKEGASRYVSRARQKDFGSEHGKESFIVVLGASRPPWPRPCMSKDFKRVALSH